jgi:hypothetical protein
VKLVAKDLQEASWFDPGSEAELVKEVKPGLGWFRGLRKGVRDIRIAATYEFRDTDIATSASPG